MKELRKPLELVDDGMEVMETAPESGERVIDINSLKERVEGGRREAARLFSIQSRDSQTTLKAHMDPFDRAMDVEDEVA